MTLKPYLLAARREPLWQLGWTALFWSAGVLLVLVLNILFNSDNDYACMGTMLGLGGAVFLAISRGGVLGSDRFRLAVSSGQTRTAFFWADTLVTLGLGALWAVELRVLWHIEIALYAVLYAGGSNDVSFATAVSWPVLAVMVAVAAVVSNLITSIRLRFGRKKLLLVLAVPWALSILLPTALARAEEGERSLLGLLGAGVRAAVLQLPGTAWAAVGAVLAAGLFVLSFVWMRRAEVSF